MTTRRCLSKYFREGPTKYTSYVHNAQRRGLVLNLNETEMIRLYNMPCFYCGINPDTTTTLGGVDRIDSLGNYTMDNVVPCCKTCNFMKGKLDVLQFLKKIESISNRCIEIRERLANKESLTVMMSGSEATKNIFHAFKREFSS